MNFKITAIPFMSGTIGFALYSGEWSFCISSGVVMLVLVITKQVKLL